MSDKSSLDHHLVFLRFFKNLLVVNMTEYCPKVFDVEPKCVLYVFNCAFSLVRNIYWFNTFYANLCSQEVYSFDTKIIRFGEMYIFHDFRHFEISEGVFDC